MRKYCGIGVLVFLISLHSVGCSRQRYPQWKAAPLGLLGSWDRASSVVVADLQNVEAVGTQRIANPPWPVSPKLHRLYWCQGDLKVYSVVKGKIPPGGKKFLWGGTKPGCDLTDYGAGARQESKSTALTRVWFIREEGDYIRPVVDGGGGLFFFVFNGKWDDGQDPEKKFARLLLTPNAVGRSARDYGRRWDFEVPSTACLVLGREQCIEQIKALAALGDPLLRRRACDFLNSQFKETCSP